jgi:phospholipid/cholesterol/gamma-HCH transport system substrate-binding protein
MISKSRARATRAGAFLAVGLGCLVAALFLIGEKRSLFRSRTSLFASFSDVNGLVEGAPVRLAGIDVGTVGEIAFSENLAHKQARVRVESSTARASWATRSSTSRSAVPSSPSCARAA